MRYDDETKRAAVRRGRGGESMGRVAKAVGTTTANVSRWVTAAELAELRAEVEYLRARLAKLGTGNR